MIRGEEEVNLYLHSVINETDFPILIPERGVVKVHFFLSSYHLF
jgi:hypothetical protein